MKTLSSFLFSLFYSFSAFAYPTDWSAGAAIPPSTSAGINTTITLAYDELAQQMIAAWSDFSSGLAYYSTFNGSSWSTGQIPMGLSGIIFEAIYQTYNPASHKIFAAWSDNINPWFSIYDGSSWSIASQIPQGTSGSVVSNVDLAYDSGSNQVVATWNDGSNPYASYHDGTSWMLTEQINLGTSSSPDTDVSVSYNSQDDEIFVAWVNSFNIGPYYSRKVGGVWMTNIIPNSPHGVYYNIHLAYDSIGNRMFAAWTDLNNQRVYYTIYSGGSWSAATLINHGASPGANLDPYLAFDPDSNAMYIGWSDKLTKQPFYSVYSGGAWSTGSPIPHGVSTGAGNDVFLAYSSGQFAMFAAWDDYSSSLPIWSSTHLTPFPSSSSTPLNFRRPFTHRPVSSLPQ